MNIYEKMSAITNKMSTVAKNFTVGSGKNEYKAVKEGDILNAVKPLEAEFKVFSFPLSREVVWQDTMEFTTKYDKENIKTNICMRIKTVYRFVNIEKTDEFVDIVSFGDGIDTQDKASGKAMTYCDKYALMKAYKIETGDDPDKDPSGDIAKPNNYKTKQQTLTTVKPAQNTITDDIGKIKPFKAGKNAGKTVEEIYKTDKASLDWIIEKSTLSTEFKNKINEYINSQSDNQDCFDDLEELNGILPF